MRNAPLFVVVLELFFYHCLWEANVTAFRGSYAIFLDEAPHEFLVSIWSVDVSYAQLMKVAKLAFSQKKIEVLIVL
jgi:hypothetical protein